MAKLLRLDVAQLTDVGRKREHNEDNMAYVIPKDPQVMAHKGALFIVADGMGGHAAGEVASEIAVDTISNIYYQDDNDDVPTSLLNAIRRANAAIHQRAAENMLRSGMGTTCVAAVLRGNMAYIANVGDSRAYLVRKARIRQVSQDHSWVAEQVRAGLLTEEQARTHAQRNVITRSLGTQLEVEIDIFREILEEGDTLVLCSDGLSGLVNDEELLRTVDQFVPQESVYHLVERANENGGPDNITAIVARVQDLGVEPPNVRQPVPVGGPEVSNEDTARLFAPVGAMTARNGEIPAPGSSFPYISGPLVSPESDTAPQPALRAKRQRGRLFYPTMVLVILFVLAAGVGSTYYFLRMNQSQANSQTLNSASQLISLANNELTNNPAQALQDLSKAQQQLQGLQNLDSSASTRLANLQTQLVSETKTAITNYNQAANIVPLPCTSTPPISLSGGAAETQTQAMAVIQNNGSPVSYVLGQDKKIYQLIPGGSNQFNLGNAFSSPANTQIISMVGAGKVIFALSEMTNNSTPGYSVYQLSPDAHNLLQNAKSQGAIDSSLTQKGAVPTLITAWGNNVYVVLASTASPNTAMILSYQVDAKTGFNTPKQTSISVSAGIIGITAFPQQLFLLLADGTVQSAADQALSKPTQVYINTPIASPLAVGSQNFTANTSVPTPAPTSQKGKGPLNITIPSTTNLATMSAGTVNADGTVHLFIGESANHRVLDLMIPLASSSGPDATPTATPTGNAPGNSVTLNLYQQYVSPNYFSTIKSVATDPGGTEVNILSQNTSNAESLTVVSAGANKACAS